MKGKCEQKKEIGGKYIEQIVSKQPPSKLLYLEKSYLDNLPSEPSMSNPLGEYPYKQLMMDKSENSNCTWMENFLLLSITIGSE